MDLSKFHVVTMISNPVRYKSRYELYRKFRKHMADSGVRLWTCEVQQGRRPFAITHAGDERSLQLRTESEIWHKENAMNLMTQRLPYDWEVVCFIDADIAFARWSPEDPHNWVQETWHQLQNYAVVQMWQTCIDLGPNGEAMSTAHSFMSNYIQRKAMSKRYLGWHPGFAWGWSRRAFDAVGGLIDTSIIGGADRAMALGLIGRMDEAGDAKCSGPYRDTLLTWQARAERFIRRDVGYVPGTIFHGFHGRKKQRFYESRYAILEAAGYDPARDLKRDYQGLYQLSDHGDQREIELRDSLKGYFRARNEDSIDTE